MSQFDVEAFGEREIILGQTILKDSPEDIIQHDRVCYWALKLGNIKLASKHAKSEKMRFRVKNAKREISLHS